MIKSMFVQSVGVRRAEGAFDKMVVGYANDYRAGHPSMGCSELKALALRLSEQTNSVDTLLRVGETVVGRANVVGNGCAVTKMAAK